MGPDRQVCVQAGTGPGKVTRDCEQCGQVGHAEGGSPKEPGLQVQRASPRQGPGAGQPPLHTLLPEHSTRRW